MFKVFSSNSINTFPNVQEKQDTKRTRNESMDFSLNKNRTSSFYSYCYQEAYRGLDVL